jgi:hypothetical protein
LTAGQLAEQIEKAGFRPKKTRRFGFYLPVIAEFGGRAGAGVLRAVETAIRPIPIVRGLLWTQGWVLKR